MNLIFVHGVLGFREKFGVEYFRGVAKHFRGLGFHVFMPELDPTRGVEFRGAQLRDQISAAFSNGLLEAGAMTHVIAHSMGGLDSRYMLSPANPDALTIPVRSLTTISTPHFGSPVADALDSAVGGSLLSHLLESALGGLGISLECMRDLTTTSCRTFSARYVDRPGVAYFSVAGIGRDGLLPTAGPLLPFHRFIWDKAKQANDGMVPQGSAAWGMVDPQPWRADHAEEIGYNLDDLAASPPFAYIAKYEEAVRRAAAL